MTSLRRPNRHYEYADDGPAIYADSFATIRREARLDHLPANAERLAVRMIHGTGQVDLADDLVIHPDLVPSARAALRAAQRDAAIEIVARYHPDAVVAVGVPFGHTRPQWVLPYGGTMTVDGVERRVWADYD